MRAQWLVEAGSGTAAVYLSMPGLHELEIRQDENVLRVDSDQLRQLLDTLFWLDELHGAGLQEAAVNLSEQAVVRSV
ncbi:hypothetical protein SAMN04487820_103154 [Actinopolyspora mzabensis]|uniref:Uncharacterized protein n=2 Tax=Actinopolyspora mzabensis TaxID=995066 RepID=A0A1G8XZ45_ACTMZ|nr:hypothetical protein SAMN04487820_103154 [Actinopolyspora mzabensis]